jgi:hypothetical protein
METKTVILVGGPGDGQVVAMNAFGPFIMPEMRGDNMVATTYVDSGARVDGAHIFVVTKDWTPPPIDWVSAHINWRNVFYVAMQHGGDPKNSPLVDAFHRAWRTHFPKRIDTDRVNHINGGRVQHAGCGGHAKVWPCADAKAMAKPLGGTETCGRGVIW